MITLRPAQDRGHADFGWLDTNHTFSFGRYHDPDHMGYRTLRVLNDDIVAAGAGFPTHPHDNMEIISYVLSGKLRHEDSTGTGSTLEAGDVQRMSAGSGVTHSEFNGSDSEPLHFLQVWILPERPGLTPGYEEKNFPAAEKRGRLRLLASPEGAEGSLTIHQDVRLYATILGAGESVAHSLADGRGAWIHVARGRAELNGKAMEAGDGASVEGPADLRLTGTDEAEILLFDLG